MDVGAARFVEHPGDKDLVNPQDRAADRALPPPAFLQAVDTAVDVHKPALIRRGGIHR
jgi:hypothetical protein